MALDIGGTMSQMYNFSLTPAEADARAVCCDWLAVGGDIKRRR